MSPAAAAAAASLWADSSCRAAPAGAGSALNGHDVVRTDGRTDGRKTFSATVSQSCEDEGKEQRTNQRTRTRTETYSRSSLLFGLTDLKVQTC